MSDINYQCSVVAIKELHKLEGLDRLLGTNIYGNQVLVGVDTEVGEIGLYFPPESQLGEEFCLKNDLLRRKDEKGKTCGGMFDQNRRVKCMKFKGNPSSGFYIPLNSLEIAFPNEYILDKVNVGNSFNELEGHEISKKYIPRSNRNPNSNMPKQNKKDSRVIKEYFPEHIDTQHLFRNLDKIKQGSLLYFTWKLHGTSGRCGNVLVKQKTSFWDKLKRFNFNYEKPLIYDYLYGSRTVVKNC